MLFWGCENASSDGNVDPPLNMIVALLSFMPNMAKTSPRTSNLQNIRLSATILSLTENNALDSVMAPSARVNYADKHFNMCKGARSSTFLFGRFLALTACANKSFNCSRRPCPPASTRDMRKPYSNCRWSSCESTIVHRERRLGLGLCRCVGDMVIY